VARRGITGPDTGGEIGIRLADAHDRDRIFELLREAAVWLRERDIDYWQNWHEPPPLHRQWVDDGISSGQFRVVERRGRPIGCLRLQDSDELFWGVRDEPAVYVHSLTIDRSRAGQGIGERVLSLVEVQAAAAGARFVRLDCGVAAPGGRDRGRR